MKIFFILDGATEQYDKTIALISALTSIESVGFASDLTDALDSIRLRHPNISIFTNNNLNEDMRAIMMASLKSGHSVVMLPPGVDVGDRCAYLGVEIDHKNREADWILTSIQRIIHKYYDEKRRPRAKD